MNAYIGAALICLPEGTPSPSTWQVVTDGSKWDAVVGVKVSLVGVNSVRISGITGPKADLNGIYEPSEEISGGVNVYQIRGGAGSFLEFEGGGKKRWTIKSSSAKGSSHGLPSSS